jgi:hypothetical protein
MAGNQGEAEKGLALLKRIDILRIWKVFGSVISFGSGQLTIIGGTIDL